MAIINGATLLTVGKAFKKEFTTVLNDTPTAYERIATVTKANTPSVDYGWLGQFPTMKKWVGDRVIEDLTAHKYSIVKDRFESTIEVDRDYIVYDNLGVMKPAIQELARGSKTHYDETVFGLLESNGNCYDGKKFFATTHSMGGVTYKNKATDVLSMESFFAKRKEMMSIKGEKGKPLGIKPNLLVVPPALEEAALKIVTAETINGTTNIAKGLAEVLVVPHLSSETGWYLMDDTRAIKPVILQINQPIRFTPMDKADDEAVFMRAAFRYGVDAEHNAGYGLWQLAYYCDGTAA